MLSRIIKKLTAISCYGKFISCVPAFISSACKDGVNNVY